MKYHVLSPDNLPIKPKPFSSREAAERGLDEWLTRFVPQGYYRTDDCERIPLDKIKARCSFQPCN
jgi:hypothetical protein